MTCRHTHTSAGADRCYTGCIAHPPFTDCDPRAHGGITYTQTCLACGKERSWAINHSYAECSSWHESATQIEAREDARVLETTRKRAKSGQVVVVLRADRLHGATIGVAEYPYSRWARKQCLSWRELEEAAAQDDADYAAIYSVLLRDAREMAEVVS